MSIRVLVGAPANVPTPVFEAHFYALARQELPPGVELHAYYVLNNHDDQAAAEQTELVMKTGGRVALEEPLPQAEYDGDARSHHWTDRAFDYVARLKQHIIQVAVSEGFDYWWLVDADLVCDRRTLASLLMTQTSIPVAAAGGAAVAPVSAVFWTDWAESQAHRNRAAGPNLWMEHPNDGALEPRVVANLVRRRVTPVAGSGACTLFPTATLRHGLARYYPRFKHMPADFWNAEDRVMALTLEAMQVPQIADPWPDIYHAYAPKHRTVEALKAAVADLERPVREFAMPTDRVSLMIKDPEGHIHLPRGRQRDLTPEVRAAVWPEDYPLFIGERRALEDGSELFLLDAKPVDLPFQYGRTGHWVDAPQIPFRERPEEPQDSFIGEDPDGTGEDAWGETELVEL